MHHRNVLSVVCITLAISAAGLFRNRRKQKDDEHILEIDATAPAADDTTVIQNITIEQIKHNTVHSHHHVVMNCPVPPPVPAVECPIADHADLIEAEQEEKLRVKAESDLEMLSFINGQYRDSCKKLAARNESRLQAAAADKNAAERRWDVRAKLEAARARNARYRASVNEATAAIQTMSKHLSCFQEALKELTIEAAKHNTPSVAA